MPAESTSTSTSTSNNGAAAAAAAEDRPIRRRVRTGCQRCRVRRRKCDERKPVCSNCAERSFECQYGLQLRFPAGNARTAPRVGGAAAGAPALYTQIRFADDPEDKDDAGGRRASDTSSRTQSIASQAFKHKRTAPADQRVRRTDEDETGQQRHHDNTIASPGHTFQFHQFATPPQHDAHVAASTRHLQAGSAEHGAIQSLVSLATSTTQQPYIYKDDILSHGHIVGTSEDGHSQQDAGQSAPTPRPSSAVTSTTHIQPPPRSPADGISEERDLDLLRYYRYHVAPWLDMLDLNHHLGLHLPTIGAESPSTIYALHALSARHRELAAGVPDMAQFESERYYNMSKWGSGAMRPVNMPDTLESQIVRLIVDLISAPLSSWARHLEQSTALIAPLHSHALKPGLPASLFWCVFRFDLATALVNETSMATDLDAIFPQEGGLPGGSSSLFHDPGPNDNLGPNCVDQYALRALYLCGKAVRVLQDHRQREAGDERPRPQNHLMQWQSTWSELTTWYTGRHKFVKPLLELSLSANNSDSSPHAEPPPAFPTIIFTTAAATLANLAYHTAATILLDCKPKTLKMPGQQLSPAVMKSPHWHAQRTCAIAVGNAGVDDGGSGWDPCVIACVLHAARKMTHRDQQAAVLETLGRGREATGWRIEGELQRLQEFWQLAEHS